jgi:hypothetical protein
MAAACNLPLTWEVEYSDMLMADDGEWPGPEVEMLFGDSDWFENSDWDKDPSPVSL